MKSLLFAIVLSVSMVFSGCNREKPVELTPDMTKQLLGHWQLVQPVSSFATTLDVEVDQYSGGTASGLYSFKLSGKAAVNSYFTSARLLNWSTGSVEIGTVNATKVGGSAEAMLFEQTYYANLKAVNRYELTDQNRLKLYYDGGILEYER